MPVAQGTTLNIIAVMSMSGMHIMKLCLHSIVLEDGALEKIMTNGICVPRDTLGRRLASPFTWWSQSEKFWLGIREILTQVSWNLTSPASRAVS